MKKLLRLLRVQGRSGCSWLWAHDDEEGSRVQACIIMLTNSQGPRRLQNGAQVVEGVFDSRADFTVRANNHPIDHVLYRRSKQNQLDEICLHPDTARDKRFTKAAPPHLNTSPSCLQLGRSRPCSAVSGRLAHWRDQSRCCICMVSTP